MCARVCVYMFVCTLLPHFVVYNWSYVSYTIGFRPSEYHLDRLQRDNIQIQLSIVVVVVLHDYSALLILTSRPYVRPSDVSYEDPMQLRARTSPAKGAL